LSHQLPDATGVVEVGLVVVTVVDAVTAVVEVVMGLEAVVVTVVVVELAVPQEARSIAVTNTMLRMNHVIFLFNFSSM
jgi:hypothetical protein